MIHKMHVWFKKTAEGAFYPFKATADADTASHFLPDSEELTNDKVEPAFVLTHEDLINLMQKCYLEGLRFREAPEASLKKLMEEVLG